MELTFNHKTYTEYDRNIDVLATSKANCMYRLWNGTCKQSNCALCRRNIMYRKCERELAVCDKIALEDKASEIYYEYRANERRNRENDATKGLAITIFAFVFGACMLMGIYCLLSAN